MKKLLEFIKRHRRWTIIGLVILGVTLYSLLNNAREPATAPSPIPSPGQTNSQTSLPAQSPQPVVSKLPASPFPSPTDEIDIYPQAQTLLNQPTYFAELNSDKSAIYYFDPNEPALKQFNVANQATETLAEFSAPIETLAWSPDHRRLLVGLINQQGNRVQNPYYQGDLAYGEPFILNLELTNKSTKRLHPKITTFSYLTNDRIIYQFQEGIHNNLSIAKPDGQDWRNIELLSGDAVIIRTGQTALVKLNNSQTVRRYDSSGKRIKQYKVPNDFLLEQSAWSATEFDAVYWADTDSGLVIKRLNDGKVTELTYLNEEPQDLSIMWDNKKGDIYLYGYAGLRLLSGLAN